MHPVYAGFEEGLNRRSYEEHGQFYVLKLGYCQFLESWEDHFNDGFKNKKTGEKESLPLALCKGWRRIATVEAGRWKRGTQGIERRLLEWANAKFGSVHLLPALDQEVCLAHQAWRPGTKENMNGLGELRCISAEAVPDMASLVAQGAFNDPMTDELIAHLAQYFVSELTTFAVSLGLKKV